MAAFSARICNGFDTICVHVRIGDDSRDQNSYQSLMPLRGTWNDENCA